MNFFTYSALLIFFEVLALHDPTHNTRSISWAVESSITNSSLPGSALLNDSDHQTQTPDQASLVLPRRAETLSQPLERYSPRIFFMDVVELTSYEEASACADSAKWQLAMELEINSIQQNKT